MQKNFLEILKILIYDPVAVTNNLGDKKLKILRKIKGKYDLIIPTVSHSNLKSTQSFFKKR